MRNLLLFLALVCAVGGLIGMAYGNLFTTLALFSAATTWALLAHNTSKDVNR